jgi:predicted DNA-binding transcriptional regulator YafY
MNRKNGEEKVKLSRIVRLDEEIRSGKYPNSEELAAKMEVNPRTILRDIEYLRTFYDAPIEYDFNKRGFYYTEPNFFIKSIILTEDEFQTITLYDSLLNHVNNTEFETKFRKIIGKILAVVPENKTKDLPFTPPESDFIFAPSRIIDGNIASDLSSAIKTRQVIEVEYWVSDNSKYSHLTLEPFYLFFERHGYYLLARKHEGAEKPGIYSTHRMKNLHLTKLHFEIPEGLKLKDYIKKEADVSPADNKIYFFELQIHKDVAADALEHIFYHSQKMRLCDDGAVLVQFRSTRLHEIFRWVLGQGYKVKVLNPPELITMIKREIQKVGQYYNT